jgi:hypothetical protein
VRKIRTSLGTAWKVWDGENRLLFPTLSEAAEVATRSRRHEQRLLFSESFSAAEW